jgi:hypothetical protein
MTFVRPQIRKKIATKGDNDQRITATLIEAINRRNLIELFYDGYPRLRVEPYILGYSSAGKLLLSCYQNDGASRQSPVPGWKNFKIGTIQNLLCLEEDFHPRPDYNRKDRTFRQILEQV